MRDVRHMCGAPRRWPRRGCSPQRWCGLARRGNERWRAGCGRRASGNGPAVPRCRTARAIARPVPGWRPGRNPTAGTMRSSLPTSLRRRPRTRHGVVLPATGLVFGVAGEREQVLALVRIQPERIRDRGQHTGRGPGLAALLQPRVPGQADVRELSDLFPAQAGNPPHPPLGKPHLGRAQPGAAGTQERAQLAAPVPHRTGGGAGLLIARHGSHDEPRIPWLAGRPPGSGTTRSGRHRMPPPGAARLMA
jgi:hypothetical protein